LFEVRLSIVHTILEWGDSGG